MGYILCDFILHLQTITINNSIITRICAGLGMRMKFKTLFMSDHDLLLFFNMSNQFLAPGGLNAECVQVNVM